MSKQGGSEFVLKRRGGFTVVPNSAVQDEGLSLEARGFLAYIMSLPTDWVFHPAHLMKVCRVGRDKYYSLVRELKKAGYLEIKKRQDSKGRFSGSEWEIRDGNRTTENPDTVNPDAGKTALIEKKHSLQKNKHTKQTSDCNQSTASGSKASKVTGKCSAIVTTDSFEDFWSKHPRPRDRGRSLDLFNKALERGADPLWIVEAAQKYSNSMRDKPKQYVATSANWLDQRRWEDHASSRKPTESPGATAIARFWAEKIRKSSYIPPNAINEYVARLLLRDHGITHEQLIKIGLRLEDEHVD